MRINIDFETRCDIDISAGVENYTRHPSFRLLLCAWSVDGGEVQQTEGELPDLPWNDPGVEFHAFNAAFEMACLRALGCPAPASRWHCTMVHAYSRGFAGGLADVGVQAGLPEEMCKYPDGKRLVTKFCSPRSRVSKANSDPYWGPSTAPEAWERFKAYNRQDVVAEAAIGRLLALWGPETAEERKTWELDQRINGRGLPVDMRMVRNALLAADRIRERQEVELYEITGLGSGQTQRLRDWLSDRGCALPDLQAKTIEDALKGPLDKGAARVLQLRSALSQAAVSKFAKIEEIETDGRCRHLLQLRGAQRTGRWAGRALQVQNLKRPTVKDPDRAAELLVQSVDLFDSCYTLEDLGSLVRSSICAPEGKTLVAADLASIESRVLGWVTRCRKLNQVFEQDLDPYKAFAVEWMRKPYDQVTKQERNLCKPPTLGCGYGMWIEGLIRYADSMGVEMTEDQSRSAVLAFRNGYPEVPVAWREVEGAFSYATATGLPVAWNYNILFAREGDFTTIRLPSGRKLWYYHAAVEDGVISFMGQNSYTHKWERIFTYGAKLIENIVQAIACDVLLHGMEEADSAGIDIVFHVHDEIVAEESEDRGEETLAALVSCMCKTPAWAPSLILKAEGYCARRYRKG